MSLEGTLTNRAMAANEGETTADNSMDENVSNKRVKTEMRINDVLSADILQKDTVYLKQKYKHAKPFPYGHIPDIFRADFLKQVISEIKDNSVVNFKESDLFRVFQSIDLANLQQAKDETKMPAVMQLRSVLYSAEWRRWMEDMNDLEAGTLSEQVDCACNCHMAGCHLLCHDDVIGTRKISYILYLTEAEPEWSASEGGALELYDSKTTRTNDTTTTSSRTGRRIPEPVPCVTLLPVFNHMAFFVVEPGYSFHAVQEVLGERPRLSLQGWYHAKTAPVNLHDATLLRLKSYQGKETSVEEDTEGKYERIPYSDMEAEVKEVKSLSEADRVYLAEYLPDAYLKDEAIAEIRNRFEQDSSVQLRNFLSDTWVEKLKAASAIADDRGMMSRIDSTRPEYYEFGVSEAWKTLGPAHKQRFLEYILPLDSVASTVSAPPGNGTTAADAVGIILYQIRTKLLHSPAFARFLGLLTSLGLPTAQRGRVRRFRPGRDYTVAHYGLLTDISVLDATLCFVAGVGGEPAAAAENVETEEAEGDDVLANEADEIWQSGDCGGFECYIAADDGNEDGQKSGEAADEYNQDDDTELLSVSASNNTLSLVYRDPGTMRFIKYVGSKAPGSRWDVAMEYEVPTVDDDGEEEGAVVSGGEG